MTARAIFLTPSAYGFHSASVKPCSGWIRPSCYALYGGVHLRDFEARVTASLHWRDQWGLHNDAPGGAGVGAACRRLIEGPAPAVGELDVLGLLADIEARPVRVQLDVAVLTAVVQAAYSWWAEVIALLDGRIEQLEEVLRGSWYIGPSRVLWGIACAELARSSTGSRKMPKPSSVLFSTLTVRSPPSVSTKT